MSRLGTVITTEESPSTSEFSFVSESGNKALKKGLYVQTKNEEGIVFGYIAEIFRANRYFERAESVAEYEKEARIDEQFPASEWEHLISQVKILGTYSETKFLRTSTPPFPGAQVDCADEALLKKFLGFKEGELHFGNLQHHEVKADIDMTRLLQKHFAILAMSGAGKSHLASVILEELLERPKEKGRVAVVIIDIHGEYIGFKHDRNYSSRTKVIDGKEMSIPLRKISPETMSEWFPTMSHPQREILRAALCDLKKKSSEDRKPYSLKDLMHAIDLNKETAKDNSKGPLKRIIHELRRFRFIDKVKENPKLLDDVKGGEILILDFSGIDNMRKKQILVSYISRKLFNLRKKEKIPPFLLLIEEAHNFAKEKAEAYDAVSRGIIETIAREGRKFGASLCLISQRPVNLSTTALSQCNTHVILRITNPNDLDHIQQSSEGIDYRVSKSITSLRTGEGIIVGEAVNYPIFVSIRDRKSEKRERGKPLWKQALEFEEKKEKQKKDVEAFL
ncbi:MAG: helicase HerA domain-containing protein [Candidatus Bilamarchaeaceae archaeon]